MCAEQIIMSPFDFNRHIHTCWNHDAVATQMNSITSRVSEISVSGVSRARKVSDYEEDEDDHFSTPNKNDNTPPQPKGKKRASGLIRIPSLTFSPCLSNMPNNRSTNESSADSPSCDFQPRKVARFSGVRLPFDFNTIFLKAEVTNDSGAKKTTSVAHPCFTPLKKDNHSPTNVFGLHDQLTILPDFHFGDEGSGESGNNVARKVRSMVNHKRRVKLRARRSMTRKLPNIPEEIMGGRVDSHIGTSTIFTPPSSPAAILKY